MRRYSPFALLFMAAISPLFLRFGVEHGLDLLSANTYSRILKYAPWFALALASWLGYRLNRTKIIFFAALFALSYWLLTSSCCGSLLTLDALFVAQTLSISLPLSALLIAIGPESALLGKRSILRLLALALPTAGLIVLNIYQPNWILTLYQFPALDFDFPLARIGFLGVIGYAVVCYRQREEAIFNVLIAVLLSFIPVYYLLFQSADGQSLEQEVSVTFNIIGVMLLYSIYRIFWQSIYIDTLTKIPNRRALDEALRFLSSRYALAMIDIDHFKLFNDKYGHQAGDQVLRMVAQHLNTYSAEKVYRYGGEEFCIVFSRDDTHEIMHVLDTLRERLANRRFLLRRPDEERKKTSWLNRGKGPLPTQKRVQITVSIGIARKKASLKTPEEVVAKADRALYRAKSKGRNCCIVG